VRNVYSKRMVSAAQQDAFTAKGIGTFAGFFIRQSF
jgi:hypothetical protein